MTKQWRNSSNGPDWTDLRAMMLALQAVHAAKVEVTISPLGTGSTGSVEVVVAAHFDVLPTSQLPETVVEKGAWPNRQNTTLEGMVYSLFWKLDFAISKIYQQEQLWK